MNVLRELDTELLLSLASHFSQWPLVVLRLKNPLRPKKAFSHVDHHYKRESIQLLTGHLKLQIR